MTTTWSGRDDFERCLVAWSDRIGVEPCSVAFRRMTTKWASCSTQGRLTFDARLLDEPRDFGEAVIVHELVHLLVRNHGRLFKATLMAYMPSCERTIRAHRLQRTVSAERRG